MQKYSPLLNKGPESLYGSPDTHPNEFGYFAFAKVIAEDLSRTYNMNFELNKYFVDRTSYVVGEENCPAWYIKIKYICVNAHSFVFASSWMIINRFCKIKSMTKEWLHKVIG